MGYTTKFHGLVKLSRKLTLDEARVLLNYAEDPDDIPGDHPERSYLQWVPGVDLDTIGWDGEEKFGDYTEWLVWICGWLAERGIRTDGALYWSGESVGDTGVLTVAGGVVVSTGRIPPAGPSFRPLTTTALVRMLSA